MKRKRIRYEKVSSQKRKELLYRVIKEKVKLKKVIFYRKERHICLICKKINKNVSKKRNYLTENNKVFAKYF
jgi:hypothetical protein